MDVIASELRSQVCLPGAIPAIIPLNSTATRSGPTRTPATTRRPRSAGASTSPGTRSRRTCGRARSPRTAASPSRSTPRHAHPGLAHRPRPRDQPLPATGASTQPPAAVNQPIGIPVSATNAQKVVQVDVSSSRARPGPGGCKRDSTSSGPSRTADPDRPREGTEMLGKLRHGKAGFTLVTVMGAMVLFALITVSAFAAVNGDEQQSGRDVGAEQALGRGRGRRQPVPLRARRGRQPGPVHRHPGGQRGQRPSRTATRAGSAHMAAAAPARRRSSRSSCSPQRPRQVPDGPNVSDTVIDKGSRSIRIRVTGPGGATAAGPIARSSPASSARASSTSCGSPTSSGFDPLLSLVDADGARTNPSISHGGPPTRRPAQPLLPRRWGDADYDGKYADGSKENFETGCSEIQFFGRTSCPGQCTPTTRCTPAARRRSGATSRTRSSRARAVGTNPNIKGTWRPNWATIGMPETNASLKQNRAARFYAFSRVSAQITLGTPAGR